MSKLPEQVDKVIETVMTRMRSTPIGTSCVIFTNVPQRTYASIQTALIKTGLAISLQGYRTINDLIAISINPSEIVKYVVLHQMSEDSPLSLLPIYKWIQRSVTLIKGLDHLYLLKDSASPVFRLNLAYIFRTYSIQTLIPGVFDVVSKVANTLVLDAKLAQDLLFNPILLPALSISMNKETGIHYILDGMDRSDEWRERVRSVESHILTNMKLGETDDITKNMMFYDEWIKYLVWEKTHGHEEDRELFYETTFKDAAVAFFTECFIMFPNTAEDLIKQRGSSKKDFSFPNIYQFDAKYFQYIRRNPPIEVDKSDELNAYLLKDNIIISNVLGRALTLVIGNMAASKERVRHMNTKSSELIFTSFIKDHMIKTSKKLLHVITFPLLRSNLVGYINAIMECDFFKSIPYISLDMVTEIRKNFSPQELLDMAASVVTSAMMIVAV